MPTSELAALYHAHVDVDLRSFAKRIGIEERQLQKVVIQQRYAFTGWTVVERILDGLGLNSSLLLRSGDLHEVPARDSRNAARSIVEDMYFAQDIPIPTYVDEIMESKIDQLLALRNQHCNPSAEQVERRLRDAERSMRRRARAQNA